MICVVRRRMNALSSTTRTRGIFTELEDTRSLAQRPHLDATIVDEEIHAASVVGAGVFTDDGHLQLGEDFAYRRHVSLTDIDARRRHEIAEHARSAGDLRADALETC